MKLRLSLLRLLVLGAIVALGCGDSKPPVKSDGAPPPAGGRQGGLVKDKAGKDKAGGTVAPPPAPPPRPDQPVSYVCIPAQLLCFQSAGPVAFLLVCRRWLCGLAVSGRTCHLDLMSPCELPVLSWAGHG